MGRAHCFFLVGLHSADQVQVRRLRKQQRGFHLFRFQPLDPMLITLEKRIFRSIPAITTPPSAVEDYTRPMRVSHVTLRCFLPPPWDRTALVALSAGRFAAAGAPRLCDRTPGLSYRAPGGRRLMAGPGADGGILRWRLVLCARSGAEWEQLTIHR